VSVPTRAEIDHCVGKVVELTGRAEPSRRDLLQLGYNLGRLSELTGGGREPFWDRWKQAVDAWDRPALERLACDLRAHLANLTPDADGPSLHSPRRHWKWP
jgi:hypothetical protein